MSISERTTNWQRLTKGLKLIKYGKHKKPLIRHHEVILRSYFVCVLVLVTSRGLMRRLKQPTHIKRCIRPLSPFQFRLHIQVAPALKHKGFVICGTFEYGSQGDFMMMRGISSFIILFLCGPASTVPKSSQTKLGSQVDFSPSMYQFQSPTNVRFNQRSGPTLGQ